MVKLLVTIAIAGAWLYTVGSFTGGVSALFN